MLNVNLPQLRQRYGRLISAIAISAGLMACDGDSRNSITPTQSLAPVTSPSGSVIASPALTKLASAIVLSDKAVFTGPRNNYTVVKAASGYTVIDNVGQDGTTNLTSSIGRLEFSDVAVNLTIAEAARGMKAADLQLLIELYIAFFNRIPEADGLTFWINRFVAGDSINKIADDFYTGAIAYPNLTGYSLSMPLADFVKIIYKNVLGRSGTTAPPEADVNFWVGRINSGADTTGTLIRSMLDSAHTFAGDPTWGWTARLLDNKYTVGHYFAVQQGLNYLTPEVSIQKTMEIAAAITPDNTTSAIALIPVTPGTKPADPTTPTPNPLPALPAADDPLLPRQWHLKNSGQILPGGMTGIRGEDLNVEPVWLSCNGNGTCMGEGTTIAVVDDGVEIAHTDLQPNISTLLKHRLYMANGVGYDGDPTPTAGESYHGTSIAGIIAARDSNGVGGRGVAPRASVVGYRYFGAVSGGGRMSAQKDAMEYQASAIDVSSNSWGANDDGQLHPSNTAWQSGILEGLRIGRGGKGTNYVWAAGNGGRNSDMSNYDGQANFRGVIAVGATTAQGKAAAYSERGANLWVVAPSSTNGCEGGIVTVDRTGDNGRNRAAVPNDIADVDYTQCMGGTSSAAPMVSGVVALMLQANPSLSWRDVRAVLAKTARQVDPANQGWLTNAAGHKFSDAYGFGAVNAAAAVTEARAWPPLPAERPPASATQNVNLPIAEGSNAGLTQSLSLSNTGIRNIEWVDVTLDADHPNAGDLIIGLVAPSGTISILAEPHRCLQFSSDGTSTQQTDCNQFTTWRFGVAQLLDEPADGNWSIVLIDDVSNGRTGVLKSWKVDVYGH